MSSLDLATVLAVGGGALAGCDNAEEDDPGLVGTDANTGGSDDTTVGAGTTGSGAAASPAAGTTGGPTSGDATTTAPAGTDTGTTGVP